MTFGKMGARRMMMGIHRKPTTFAELVKEVRSYGSAQALAQGDLLGVEIPDTWTANNGTVYDNPMIVTGVNWYKGEDDQMHLGALCQRKWASYNNMQFDAAEGVECDSTTEMTAEDGISYYGLAIGATSKTAANLTLLTLSTGDALPYSDYAKIYKNAVRDESKAIMQYGYNNWKDSVGRQYLNSNGGAGNWWTATHVGDVAPAYAKSGGSGIRGYMAGCSTDLLAAVKKVNIKTWPNYITDGANNISTVYETLDTFFLPSGAEMYGNVNLNDGEAVEGYLNEYWKNKTGFTTPSNNAASERTSYSELPVGSTASHPDVYARMRSPNRAASQSVYLTFSGGTITNNSTIDGRPFQPCCVIY